MRSFVERDTRDVSRGFGREVGKWRGRIKPSEVYLPLESDARSRCEVAIGGGRW
jgi:hypothetical protein